LDVYQVVLTAVLAGPAGQILFRQVKEIAAPPGFAGAGWLVFLFLLSWL
jgi:hypothetical protein